MLHAVIAAIKTRNFYDGAVLELDVRPFNARSLVLSVLLGLRPPSLPARALIALAGTFGIAPGTMRTALSRMVANGELLADDGEYRLVGRLLERKAAQDIGRRPAATTWNGDWWIAVVTEERRHVSERRAFRSHMANLRMGELRPDTWMRPANLDGPRGDDGLAVVRGPLDGADPVELVQRLWPIEEFVRGATDLLRRLDAAEPTLRGEQPGVLPSTIGLSAVVVRFLRAEPLLPPQLVPRPWPPDELRRRYADFDRAFGAVVARRTVAASTAPKARSKSA